MQQRILTLSLRPAPHALALILVAMLVTLSRPALAQLQNPSEHPAIAYSTRERTDTIARLQRRLDAGETELTFDRNRGYLPSLLQELDISISSQVLVFSRTSLQVDRIAPWTPRAIYFNDDVYVAWVQGGPIMEIASVDPNLGAVFYTLPQQPQPPGSPTTFNAETGTCLMCHDSSSITGGVPGFIVRSVLPDRYGYPISVNEQPTTDRTPLEQRWGGWYVSGKSENQKHSGNTMSPSRVHEVGNLRIYAESFDLTSGGSIGDLSERFNTAPYLSSESDMVALMVLSHQATLHNLITSAGYEARKALHDERTLLVAAGRPETSHLQPTIARVERVSEALVRGMLFVKQAPLAGPIHGTSTFAEEFVARGPADDKGRSLRDFDLQTRLFRYPLSFLIYSESFDALPDVVKQYVYRRVREVLEGTDDSGDFAHLGAPERSAILEILSATKPEFRSSD